MGLNILPCYLKLEACNFITMNNILFLGDSITEGFDFKKHLPEYHISNKGIWGVSSQELYDKIDKLWFKNSFKQVFLCVGTNDLTRKIPHGTILANLVHIYLKCLEYNKGNITQFYFASVFPVKKLENRDNDDVDELNHKIHIQATRMGCDYLHLNPFFKAGDGELNMNYSDDGLHLNAEGYQLWAKLLKNLI